MTLWHVHVIGGGAWGTALAQAAALSGSTVSIGARDPEVVADINARHRNARYLGAQALSPDISAAAGFGIPDTTDLVLMVVPAQKTRAALTAIGPKALAGRPVVMCAKGFEAGTLALQSEILLETAPEALPLALSGPSFAADVAAGRPTAVTLAGPDSRMTERVAAALAGPTFRPYAASDLVGVELAGGLKNVYALACGAVEGAGLGLSARSALIGRAYAEMTRLVVRMGGQAATLTGLAGLGDLTLSCTSEQSRNYRFGVHLGQGRSREEVEAESLGLAEGVKTAPVAQHLAERHGVDAPLIGAVNALLGGEMTIDGIVAGLMARPLKREGED